MPAQASNETAQSPVNVLVIARVTPAQLDEIASVDPRLHVEHALRTFVPELAAEWPPFAIQNYIPAELRDTPDSPELAQRRDDLLRQAHVLYVGFPYPRRLLSRAPNLRFAHHPAAAISNMRRSELWGGPVPLTSGRGTNNPLEIAEWVITVTLALHKQLPRSFVQRQEGRVDRWVFRQRVLRAQGKTMAIVGLGGIGRNVAQLASALGMRVIGSRRSSEPVEHVAQLFFLAGLHDMLCQADTVVLCAAVTPETHHLMNRQAFTAIKPGAFLVNVAGATSSTKTRWRKPWPRASWAASPPTSTSVSAKVCPAPTSWPSTT